MVNGCGIILLAAGPSTRLGKPKQLLQHNGKSLLKNSMEEALNANADSVMVVLGAHSNLLYGEIDKNKVQLVVNTEWEEGMASSIRIGLKSLLKLIPSVETVIFIVCDQPHLSASLLNELLITHQKTGKPIVASNYGEAIGPPALFHKSFFSELMQLKGDTGAKKIIQQHSSEIATVSFPEGQIDIDSPADYEALQKY